MAPCCTFDRDGPRPLGRNDTRHEEEDVSLLSQTFGLSGFPRNCDETPMMSCSHAQLDKAYTAKLIRQKRRHFIWIDTGNECDVAGRSK